jgi:hypothetical protein
MALAVPLSRFSGFAVAPFARLCLSLDASRISRCMKLRTSFFPVALAIALAGCAGRRPSTEVSLEELPDTVQWGQYKVAPYIRTAVALQALEHAAALERLHALAQSRDANARVIILCRMLFAARPGSDFRSPGIGAASFFGGTDYSDWPIEPIELVDGVPFLITGGYSVGGEGETDEQYLDYCERSCEWSSVRYSIKTKQQEREALTKLTTSAKWKKPLDAREQEFLANQIQAQDQRTDNAWKEIASWLIPMPKVAVLSGCELKIDGIQCRLFGVRDSKDAETAKRAKRFLELYLQTFGGYFSIYNACFPVNSKDGIPLVWVLGRSNGGWAQETLVEAGLVEVDYTGFENYHFCIPGKEKDVDFDWKRCFKDAVASHKAGKEPKIYFVNPTLNWPEATKK